MEKSPQNKRLRKTALACTALAVVLAAGVVIGLLLNRPAQETDTETGLGGMFYDYGGETALPTAGDVSIQIPGITRINLEADADTAYVELGNPPGNPCYFQYQLTLADTGESLFITGLIEPGKAIREAELARTLPAGEYAAVLNISTTSLENGGQMNGANIKITLHVA